MNVRRGFTLAEVLITLSIIGVVAALTIPSLIVKNQEKQTVVQVKKLFANLSNAVKLAETDYGAVEGWGWGNDAQEGSANAFEVLSKYLNTIQVCSETKPCYTADNHYIDGSIATFPPPATPSSRPTSAILADGSSLTVIQRGVNCTYSNQGIQNLCGSFSIDINGAKKPNTYGKDIFDFYIRKNGTLTPNGSPEQNPTVLQTGCRQMGWSCAGWILTKENMDYLHKNVTWDD